MQKLNNVQLIYYLLNQDNFPFFDEELSKIAYTVIYIYIKLYISIIILY